MITTKKLHVFATKLGLGTDQASLISALQSVSAPSSHILGWIATPESLPEPYLSAVMNVIGDDEGEVEADTNDLGDGSGDGDSGSHDPGVEPEPVVVVPPVDNAPAEDSEDELLNKDGLKGGPTEDGDPTEDPPESDEDPETSSESNPSPSEEFPDETV